MKIRRAKFIRAKFEDYD